eukprot:scaffold770_cov255-Pinguiococcus_pyrenoidosus.AAC.41
MEAVSNCSCHFIHARASHADAARHRRLCSLPPCSPSIAHTQHFPASPPFSRPEMQNAESTDAGIAFSEHCVVEKHLQDQSPRGSAPRILTRFGTSPSGPPARLPALVGDRRNPPASSPPEGRHSSHFLQRPPGWGGTQNKRHGRWQRTDRNSCHRHPSWHLHNRVQAIHSAQRAGLHWHANDGQRCQGADHP